MSVDISSISNAISTTTNTYSGKTKSTSSESTSSSSFDETAAVYEKSDSTTASTVSKTSVKDNSAIVEQLKADAQARENQLLEIVRKTVIGQASTSLTSMTGLKSLFENLQVDDATIAKAKEDTAEDGYWGVEQTSERILDFAKALSGGDSSKAESLLEAFKKGYEQATSAWGDTLPDLCQQTYEAVEEKFQKWINGEEE